MVGSHDGLILAVGVASKPTAIELFSPATTVIECRPHLFNLTHAVMGKCRRIPIQNIVKTFPMLPVHRTDYLPTPIQKRQEI